MPWRPLDAHLHATHRQRLRAVELDRRLGGSNHLTQRALRVAEHVGLLSWYPVDQQVLADLEHQVLELDIARIDERHFETVQIEVCAVGPGQDARGSVVVGMDVRDDQPSQALAAERCDRRTNELDRLARVHAAVEQVDVVAVDEKENVDEAVLERDRQTELEDPFGYLVKSGHRAQLSRSRPGGTRRYSVVLR